MLSFASILFHMEREISHLRAYLPTDRRLPGFLRVWNENSHHRLYDIPCRGKADNARAAAKGNPERDPALPWGDLPSGVYKLTRVTRYDPPHRTFGATAILLDGLTGDAFSAAKNGRTGLAIHGGRGSDRLMATYGCLRLFDRDMELLTGFFGNALIHLEVMDVDVWPPGYVVAV